MSQFCNIVKVIIEVQLAILKVGIVGKSCKDQIIIYLGPSPTQVLMAFLDTFVKPANTVIINQTVSRYSLFKVASYIPQSAKPGLGQSQ